MNEHSHLIMCPEIDMEFYKSHEPYKFYLNDHPDARRMGDEGYGTTLIVGPDVTANSIVLIRVMGTFANKLEGEILRLTARDIMTYNIRAYKYEVKYEAHKDATSDDNPVSDEQKPDLSKYIIRLPISSPIRELPLFKETDRSDTPYVFNRDGIKCLLSHGPVYLSANDERYVGCMRNICSDCVNVSFDNSRTSATFDWKCTIINDEIQHTTYDIEWLMLNFDGLEMGLMEDDDDVDDYD